MRLESHLKLGVLYLVSDMCNVYVWTRLCFRVQCAWEGFMRAQDGGEEEGSVIYEVGLSAG